MSQRSAAHRPERQGPTVMPWDNPITEPVSPVPLVIHPGRRTDAGEPPRPRRRPMRVDPAPVDDLVKPPADHVDPPISFRPSVARPPRNNGSRRPVAPPPVQAAPPMPLTPLAPAPADPGDIGLLPPPAPPGQPSASNAAELTHDAILRPMLQRPTLGWRGFVSAATGGLVNPGMGPHEHARNELLRRVRRPLSGPHRIAVVSIKGGVGKTTVAACLGMMLADQRGDRVVALDANPDAGTLADRLTGDSSATVRQLLAADTEINSLTDVGRYTSLAGRLQVLASAQDPRAETSFGRDDYEQVCQVLTRFFNIVITDSGSGLVHSAMDGILALADSIVVVGGLSLDGAAGAAKTLDWLVARGHPELVAGAVVVLGHGHNQASPDVDAEAVREHFATRCRSVVAIPADRHLAAGGRIQLAALHRSTVAAYLRLTAAVADSFDMPAERSPAPEGGNP